MDCELIWRPLDHECCITITSSHQPSLCRQLVFFFATNHSAFVIQMQLSNISVRYVPRTWHPKLANKRDSLTATRITYGTGTFRIVFQFGDALEETMHDGVHLGTRLARIRNELHRFQHRSAAGRSKLPTQAHNSQLYGLHESRFQRHVMLKVLYAPEDRYSTELLKHNHSTSVKNYAVRTAAQTKI